MRSAQPIRIDVDLVLLHSAADAGHFRDTRHGIQLVANVPVLQRAEIAQAESAALDRVPEHVADTSRIRPERRHDTGGQLLGDEVQRSRTRVRAKYRSTSSSKITKIIEKPNADATAPLAPGKPLQVDGQRIGNLVLDLLRATSRPVREDDHLVVARSGIASIGVDVIAHHPSLRCRGTPRRR